MKVKSLIVYVIFILLASSCVTMKLRPRYQQKYFPEHINQLYLGMPFHNFEKIKDIQKMEINSNFDFRTEYTEVFSEGDIEEITYYFTKNEPEYLYEFILKFKSDFNLREYCRRMYGPFNDKDEWLFTVTKSLDIMIWTFDTTLVLAGKLPGTELK